MRLYLATRSRDELKSFRVSLLKKVELTDKSEDNNEKIEKSTSSAPPTPKKILVENKVEQPKPKKQRTITKPLVLDNIDSNITNLNANEAIIETKDKDKKVRKVKTQEIITTINNSNQDQTENCKDDSISAQSPIIISSSLNLQSESDPIPSSTIDNPDISTDINHGKSNSAISNHTSYKNYYEESSEIQNDHHEANENNVDNHEYLHKDHEDQNENNVDNDTDEDCMIMN